LACVELRDTVRYIAFAHNELRIWGDSDLHVSRILFLRTA
jgi:hypothetical protein